jgi:hypothetical protein
LAETFLQESFHVASETGGREYDFAQSPKGEVECTREYRNESQKGRKAG